MAREKTATPVFNLDDVFNNLTKRKQLEGYIASVVDLQKQIKKLKSEIADQRNDANAELGIPGKVLNRLVKEELKPGTLEAETKELSDVKDVSDALHNKKVDDRENLQKPVD